MYLSLFSVSDDDMDQSQYWRNRAAFADETSARAQFHREPVIVVRSQEQKRANDENLGCRMQDTCRCRLNEKSCCVHALVTTQSTFYDVY